jgi:hypothetical protein
MILCEADLSRKWLKFGKSVSNFKAYTMPHLQPESMGSDEGCGYFPHAFCRMRLSPTINPKSNSRGFVARETMVRYALDEPKQIRAQAP